MHLPIMPHTRKFLRLITPYYVQDNITIWGECYGHLQMQHIGSIKINSYFNHYQFNNEHLIIHYQCSITNKNTPGSKTSNTKIQQNTNTEV